MHRPPAMRSGSNFVRVLPWVLCLAVGAASHLVWAVDAWWGKPRVVVHESPIPKASPTTIVVHESTPHVRRTETPAASDPELLAMLVDAHVRCDDDATCTIDPRLVDYLLADPRRRGHLVLDYEHDGQPRSVKLKLRRLTPPRARFAHGSTGSRAPARPAGRPRAAAISASP